MFGDSQKLGQDRRRGGTQSHDVEAPVGSAALGNASQGRRIRKVGWTANGKARTSRQQII